MISLFSQDPDNKWADLQRALLAEGQSVWCCKSCIGIIKENKNATYEKTKWRRQSGGGKVEAAKPLPEAPGISAKVEAKATPPPDTSAAPPAPAGAAPAAPAASAAPGATAPGAAPAAPAAPPTAAADATAATAPTASATPAAPPVVNVNICHCAIL